MKDSLDDIVRETVARHLDVAPATVHLSQHVQRDLELDPLDLVLIALRLEEIEEIEFPIARLELVATVRDLVSIVRLAHARAFQTAVHAAERHPSGVRLLGERGRRTA